MVDVLFLKHVDFFEIGSHAFSSSGLIYNRPELKPNKRVLSSQFYLFQVKKKQWWSVAH